MLHTRCANEENDQKALPVTLKNSWGEILECVGWQKGPLQERVFYLKNHCRSPSTLPPVMEQGTTPQKSVSELLSLKSNQDH